MPLPYQGGLPSYGKAHSTFGHVSVEVNGESFSFGPNGMDTSATYTARQRELRDAIAHRLNLSPEQEGKVQSCLSRSRGGEGAIQAFLTTAPLLYKTACVSSAPCFPR